MLQINQALLATIPQRGTWAMMPSAIEAHVAQILSEVMANHRSGLSEESLSNLLAAAQVPPRRQMKIDGETGTIEIRGILMRKVPEVYLRRGIEATGYEDIVEDINAAVANPKLKKLDFVFDTPGGVLDGLAEAADTIYAARGKIKMQGKVDGLMASAGQWLGAQVPDVRATKDSEVGSIGVYTYVWDWSKLFEEFGIEVKRVRSGPYKGVGVPGVPITDEELEPTQENIDNLRDLFVEEVARGRGMAADEVAPLATGRTWVASEALSNGLIDEVGNLEGTRIEARADVDGTIVVASETDSQGGETVDPKKKAEEEAKKKAEKEAQEKAEKEAREKVAAEAEEKAEAEAKEKAEAEAKEKAEAEAKEKAETEAKEKAEAEASERLEGFLAEFPDDSAFALEQFKKGATLDEAKLARYEAIKADGGTKKTGKRRGATPRKHTEPAGATGDDFRAKVHALAKAEEISKRAAWVQLIREDPDGYTEYMESQQGKGSKR